MSRGRKSANQLTLRASVNSVYIRPRHSRGDGVRSVSRVTACVCLLLTLWLAVALVAHRHSATTEAAKCTVCMAAHASAPKEIVVPQVTIVPVSAPPKEAAPAQQRIEAFALTVRPPPAV